MWDILSMRLSGTPTKWRVASFFSWQLQELTPHLPFSILLHVMFTLISFATWPYREKYGLLASSCNSHLLNLSKIHWRFPGVFYYFNLRDCSWNSWLMIYHKLNSFFSYKFLLTRSLLLRESHLCYIHGEETSVPASDALPMGREFLLWFFRAWSIHWAIKIHYW